MAFCVWYEGVMKKRKRCKLAVGLRSGWKAKAGTNVGINTDINTIA